MATPGPADGLTVNRVAVSRDGQRAVLVEDVDGSIYQLPNRDTFCYDITVRPEARAAPLVAQVCGSGLTLTMLRQGHGPLGPFEGAAVRDYVELAVGEYLDSAPLPAADPERRYAFRVMLSDVLSALEARGPARDDEILRYVSAKVYWAWRFRIRHVSFSNIDALRLQVPESDFDHVAAQGVAAYWRRVAPGFFAALPRLINEFRSGVLPGLERPPLQQVEALVDGSRFPAAKKHLEKAEGFLFGQEPDFENAVKEAVLALESVAKVAVPDGGATLGKCIKEMVSRGYLTPAAGRILDSIYAYRSATPGVAHASGEVPSVTEGEARFLLDAAAGAIRMLMTIPIQRHDQA